MPAPTTTEEVIFAALFADVDKSATRLMEINAELINTIGAMRTAKEELEISADNVVEKRLEDLDTAITNLAETAMKKVITEAFGRHITGDVIALKSEIKQIKTDLNAALIQARGSQTKVIGISCLGGGLVGALLVTLFTWGSSGTEASATDKAANAAPVSQTASNMKQVPRNR